MFCPVCRYEFRRGFTHCNTCDMDLVDALPPEEEIDHTPPATAAQMDRPTLLWSGASGGIFSALTAALDDVHIPYNKEELDARLVFSSQHSDLEVWVPAANLSEAGRVRDAVLGNPLHAADVSDHGTSTIAGDDAGDRPSAAPLPDEDDEGDEDPDDIRDAYVAHELYPEDATAEIWAGKNEDMADVLKSCLAEIGINCYVDLPESGNLAVRVLPEDEKRAREIVREVTDGSPPQ